MSNFLRILYDLGGPHLKIRDVCINLEPCFKVHNLIGSCQLNNTKLGSMTYRSVIFYKIVSFYKLDRICNLTQSPAQPQRGPYTWFNRKNEKYLYTFLKISNPVTMDTPFTQGSLRCPNNIYPSCFN